MNGHGFPFGKRQITLRRWVPYGLFVAACALSVYAAFYVSTTAEERRQEQFFADAQETRRRIESRLDTYVQVVRDGTALLAASNEIHLGEFRAFVKRLELAKRYPGIEAIGFAQRVTPSELREFARTIVLDGVSRFHFRPEGNRPEYQTIVFLEPMDAGSRGALGFDLAADPAQREAMERARDTGQPALAGRAGEPFDGVAPDGVILYVPVYRSGVAVDTVDDRRRALYGFVFSPIRAGLLLDDLASASMQPVTFEVYDGTDISTATLIHASAEATAQPEYVSSGALSVAGHQWQLVVKSVAAVPALMPRPVRNTLAGGLFFSLILFVIVRVQIGAWETAKRHEVEIRASEQAVRASEARLREALAREQEARAAAQAADRAKDDFLVSVSHELRTPISAMLGWLSMMKTGTVRPERQAHALDVVERNARLQARLIEDLLDVSRILLGRMSVDLQPIAVAPPVLFVVDSLRPTASSSGVALLAPVLAGPGMIRGDVARVQQVVWNLVSNAIKFTPSGGQVSVELTDDGARVVLQVSDTGIGIAPEFLPHVFDRFSQAGQATARANAGLGLGMAITKHLVELHGGTVTAHSDGPDRGTTFVVSIPSSGAGAPVAGREAHRPETQTRSAPSLARGVQPSANRQLDAALA